MIARELQRLQLDIAGLTETRRAGSGELVESEGGYTFFWKGVEEGPRRAGVSFAIKTKLIKNMETQPVGINERIISFRYRGDNGKLILFICAYAPTMQCTLVEKEQFYEALQHLLDGVNKDEMIVVLGDFNARVGSDFQLYKGIIGRYGVGKCNDNGELLLEFCARNNLVITNTLFRHKTKHINTWQHPRSKHWHLLDYVLVNNSNQAAVMDTRVMRGANCSTDHKLVRSRLKITAEKKRIKYRQQPKPKKKINVDELKNERTRKELEENLHILLQDLSMDGSLEENWETFRDKVYQASLKTLGTKRKRLNDWFDENEEDIINIIEKKRRAWNKLDQMTATKGTKYDRVKEDYNQQKRIVQKETRRMKDEWWRRKADEIQTLYNKHDIRGTFQAIKALFGPVTRSSRAVKTLNGKILVEPDEILKRWTEHFKTLLNQFSEVDESVLLNIPQREVDESLAAPPTVEEVAKAIAKLKNNKCPGADGIPAEVFKYGGDELTRRLYQIICQIWEEEDVPQQWKDASIIKLFKKGDTMECGNYRGISILTVVGKILSNIFLVRLKPIMEAVVPESQCGFRNGRGTDDMIFCARQIQEKCKEQGMPLFMVFIDLTKAYDTVNRTLLWLLLARYGLPEKLVNLIRNMHDGMKASLSFDVGTSELFDILNGLKQGCVMAPNLFNLFFAAVVFETFRDMDDKSGVGIKFKLNGKLYNARRLLSNRGLKEAFGRDLCYADDCALTSHSQEELQLFMTSFSNATKKYGLTISFKKTEVMVQKPPNAKEEKVEIKLDGKPLKVTQEFPYLGSTLADDASIDKEIKARVKKAATSFGNLYHRVWKPRNITPGTKVAVYKACVLSVLLYGAATWNMYRRHLHKLETFHHRCLRKILGIPWQRFVPTTEILQRAKLPSIEAMLIKARLKWMGHVRRMPDHRYPKMILMADLQRGKRNFVKPAQRWKDLAKMDM